MTIRRRYRKETREAETVVFDNIPDTKYRVNGRTPIEWLVDRYNPSVDRESGIANDPLAEMAGSDVIDLIRRPVHVGVESDRLVESLPAEFEPKYWQPAKTGLHTYGF